MSNRKAGVYLDDVLTGILAEQDDGYTFTYDKEYLKSDKPCPVSLTLPLSEKPYFSHYLFPFFDGLIPEGFLLNVVINNWKVNENDRFGLLLLSGSDPIGNIKIREEK